MTSQKKQTNKKTPKNNQKANRNKDRKDFKITYVSFPVSCTTETYYFTCFFFTDSIDKMSKRVKDYLERFPAFDLLSSRALKIDNKLNTSLFDLIEI